MSSPLIRPARLRAMLEDSLLVHHIAARLETCRPDEDSSEVRGRMERHGYDVLGLVDEGRIARYVRTEDLIGGASGDHARTIESSQILASTTPLIELLPLMKTESPYFVLEGAKLNSIVTRADLQKQPVRMLLFGLVSLMDMHLTVMVQRNFAGDSYIELLAPKRREAAQKLHKERIGRNEEIDLADCLQICDKRDLILKKVPAGRLGFESRGKAERFFKSAEHLRNNLAHSQDLVVGTTWAEVIDLTICLDNFLQCIDVDPAS